MLDADPEAAAATAPQRDRRRRARALGLGSMVLCGLCLALTVTLGLLGPSSAEPWFGPVQKAPPWFLRTQPQDLLVFVLVALVLLLGAASVAGGLAATRLGWRPSAGRLLLGSSAAMAALLCVPSLGTTDPLNYAAYGRITVLGLDPYRTTPWQLALTGDPVGKLSVAEPWLHVPSVYGPLVTLTEWVAAIAGGPSMLRIVWLQSLLSAAAFLGVGALLLRLAGPDPSRRVRAQLLWSLNPVLWWNLVAGPHVDVLGVLLVAGALFALRGSAVASDLGLRRSAVAAGLALGAAAAVKPTLGALALPLAWNLRRSWQSVVRTLAVASAVAATSYAMALDAIRNSASLGNRVTVGTPWILGEQRVLVPAFGVAGARDATTVVEVLLMLLLTALLLRALPAVQENILLQSTVRTMLALVGAYLLATTYVRPWYDCVAWLLLALLPRSWFDLVLLAHTTLLTLPFDPGRPVPLHPHRLGALSFGVGYRIVPTLLAALIGLVVFVGLSRTRNQPSRATLRRLLRH